MNLARNISYLNLLNILADDAVIPELLQENCTVDKIVDTLKVLLAHPEQMTEESLKKLGLGDSKSPSDKLALELQKLAKKGRKS